MNIYRVTLKEITEHTVQVEANSESEARAEAVRGWKYGWYVDDQAMLLDLKPIACSEED